MRVTPTGIETTDGNREFDMIVWATGFDFGTGPLPRMDIRGLDGLRSGALGRRSEDVSGHSDPRVPQLLLPGGAARPAGNNPRYNGDQVEFVTETLVHLRATGCDAIEVNGRQPKRSGPPWSIAGRPKTPAFGESSYYFGTNIPGKPRKYLLNSAEPPKLLADIAKVRETNYAAFTVSGCAEHSPRRTTP